jgi:hypothetical protein
VRSSIVDRLRLELWERDAGALRLNVHLRKNIVDEAGYGRGTPVAVIPGRIEDASYAAQLRT